MDALSFLPMRRLLELLRSGQLGVLELTEHYLARIARLNDGPNGLNAVAELSEDVHEQAIRLDSRRELRTLPLFGLPILLKDSIDAAGLHTTGGSLALADNLVTRDAPVTAALRRAGAVLTGKTNMTEFAGYTSLRMPNGFSSRGGQVRHAYDRRRDPSGSSTGSAVALSAGLCAAALGTDTCFSTVACAAENGVAGLKPPPGTFSCAGILPLSPTFDAVGLLARDLDDALLLYAALRGEPPKPAAPLPVRGLRIAVNTFGSERMPPELAALCRTLLQALAADGARVAPIEQAHAPQMETIFQYEFRPALENYLRTAPCRVKTLRDLVEFYEADPARMPYGIDDLRAALDGASGPDAPPYLAALAHCKACRTQVRAQLKDFDLCVMTGMTDILHYAGLPSLSLPLGTAADGTPRGVILYGADERRLYAAAAAVSTYCAPVPPPRL